MSEIRPTHKCTICDAYWKLWGDGSWSLTSTKCKSCCNNVPMGDQIVALKDQAVPFEGLRDQASSKPVTMSREELLTLHGELTNKAFSIFEVKNHDYTGGDAGDDPFANFRASEVIGVPPELGILVRCIDKFQRIRAFVNKGELKVKGESVEDAIIDVINYMVLLGGIVREREEGSAVQTESLFSLEYLRAQAERNRHIRSTLDGMRTAGTAAYAGQYGERGVRFGGPPSAQKICVCPYCTCFVEFGKECSCVKSTAATLQKFNASVRAISCDVCEKSGGICHSPCAKYQNSEWVMKQEEKTE